MNKRISSTICKFKGHIPKHSLQKVSDVRFVLMGCVRCKKVLGTYPLGNYLDWLDKPLNDRAQQTNKLIDQIVLKPHVDSFINEHCDNCIQKSHYILDNYYLSKQMRGIIKDANHDAIYMMHYFAKEEEQE